MVTEESTYVDNEGPPTTSTNQDTFRECLTSLIVRRANNDERSNAKRRAKKARKNAIKRVSAVDNETSEVNDAQELGDFIEYLAVEIFTSFPADLQNLSFTHLQNDQKLRARYEEPLHLSMLDDLCAVVPFTVEESLISYGLIKPDESIIKTIIEPSITTYIDAVSATPPSQSFLKQPDQCEICDRSWIPLTYHHLIPRSVHAKALKRGWCAEWELNNVAWLCRACHSFVHGIATNEELAKDWSSLERLLAREDTLKWAKWVGRVRWKSR